MGRLLQVIFDDAVSPTVTCDYPRVPQQPNGVDCGFYVAEMVDRLARDPTQIQLLSRSAVTAWFTVRR